MLSSGTLPPWLRRPDAVAAGTLFVLFTIAGGFIWYYDYWLQDYDKLAQFAPWFGHIGESLRSFDLPAWDRTSAAGQPFIGAPASGWLSIPIMVCFTLIPNVIAAYKVFIYLHLLLAGFGTYAFCRVIGLSPLAAWVGGAAYGVGPVMYAAMQWEAAQAQSMMFIPLGLLAVEMALRSKRTSTLLGWSLLAGLIVCQMYVSSIPRVIWPTITLAGWMAWRLVDPVPDVGNRVVHLRKLLVIGAVLTLGFAGSVGAALLPQIDFNRQSNVAGSNYDVPNGDYTSSILPWDYILGVVFVEGDTWKRTKGLYGASVILALVALLGMRLRYGALYFAILAVGLLDFATTDSPVRAALWMIPGVEQMTHHRPLSATAFAAFPVVMLAAIGTQWLIENHRDRVSWLVRLLPAPLVVWLIWWMNDRGYAVGSWQIISTLAMALVVVLGGISGTRWAQRSGVTAIPVELRAVLLAILLFVPTLKDFGYALADAGGGDYLSQVFRRTEGSRAAVGEILDPGKADTTALFLLDRQSMLQPFRISSIGHLLSDKEAFGNQTHPDVIDFVSNGRPLVLGLESTYGYSPAQLQWYVDYLVALNGTEQDYHFTQIIGTGLERSQLLDMLNVKYVATRKAVAEQPPIADWGKLVYESDTMRIFENQYAFPRGWIVHDVQPAQDGAELALFDSGQVDGRVTAFVDGELPGVNPLAEDAPPDTVSVTSYENEEIRLSATTSADGLLVLSEMYVNGWNAYVDGEKVDILRTNHTFRGVPISAGAHEVVLKYEPRSLTIGLASTGTAASAMIGVWAWAGIDWRRSRKGK